MRRIDSGFRRLIAYAAGGVALLVFALFLNALFTAQSQPTASEPRRGTPSPIGGAVEADPFGVSFFPEEGDEDQPAFSSDGRYLAYVSIRADGQYLQVRDLTANTVTTIAPDARNPVWSPDGLHLAYERLAGNEVDLYVTDPAGTNPVKVNDVPNAGDAHWLPDSQSLLFAAPPGEGQIHIVSPDGQSRRTIAIADVWRFTIHDLSPDGGRVLGSGLSRASGQPTGLLSIDLQTEAVTPVSLGDPAATWATWSPNGEQIAYHTPDLLDANVSILRGVSAQGGEPRTISQLAPGQSVGQHAWSPDGRFIAYVHYASASVLDSGELIVVWADGSGSVPLVPGLNARGFSWSPDGSQLAIVLRNGNQFDIALARADETSLRARLEALRAPTQPAPATLYPTPTPLQSYDFYRPIRLTSGVDGDYRPAVSPDGRRVAFASERDGNWDIYVLDMATGAQTRLTDDPNPDMAPSWSPDGARIAYQHNSPDPNGPALVDRVVMHSDGTGKTVVSSRAVWIGNESPAWSPSGDRIAFSDGVSIVAVRVSGENTAVRFDPPSTGAFRNPTWLDDGQIAFVGDGALMVGDTGSGTLTPVAGTPGLAWLPMTTRASPRIGYFALEGSRIRLMSVFPNGNEPYTLAQFGANQVQHAAWSPDGRFIAYYADDSIHLAIAWSEQYRDSAPLFVIPTLAGLTDLNSLAWLPDSSGLVYVAASDGQPNLYLATLNQSAIQIYVDEYPKYAPFPGPTPPLPPTPAPTPTAWEIPPGAPTPFPTPIETIPAGTPPYWLQLIRHFGGVQVVVSGQYVWLVDENNDALFSYDAGASWSSISLPPDTQQLAVRPRFDGTDMYAAAGEGIYHASLDRLQWQSILSGGPFASVAVSSDGTLFAAERLDCRVHRSTDGGATWTASTVFTNNATDGCLLMRVIVSPDSADGSIVYALTQLHGLWRSTDRGQVWQSLGGEYWFDAAVDPADPSLVYAANGETLMRFDTNGGARNATSKLSFAGALAVGPDQTVYYGDAGGRVFASRDQGATWEEISTFSGEPIRSIVAVDQIVYVLTDGSLLGGYWEGAPVPATPTPAP